jgi:putative ABC transport system ATP-binding protein
MPGGLAQAVQSPVVELRNLNHCFGEGNARNQVLFDNAIEIGAGQLVVVTGPSGSGKTTLLSLIGALRSVQEGEIRVLDRSLAGLGRSEMVSMRRNIGFIFQAHNLFESLSAYENVKMAMALGDCPPREMRERGLAILDRLGLANRADYKPRALSGGQRQRVAVARALVNRPRLVLADEPTAALDKGASSAVVSFLKELTVEDKCTVMMVSHDNRILDLADRIVNIVDGRIVADVILADAVMICELLRGLDLFKSFTPAELTRTAERMKRRRYVPGETIIRQGEAGDDFYVIAQGEVDVLRRVEGGDELKVAVLDKGGFFGEQALMAEVPRNATCLAKTEVDVYCLTKDDFRRAVETSPSFRQQLQTIYFRRQ